MGFGSILVGLLSLVPAALAQENSDSEKDREKDGGKKHYLTFQVSYSGSAHRLSSDGHHQNETSIEVDDRFSGRIEMRPTEAYDLPSSVEAQTARFNAIQAAMAAGDVKALNAATPPLLVTWYPVGSEVEITGTISETKRSRSTDKEMGESRAKSDRVAESYRGQNIFMANFGNAFVKIRAEEKLYDLQFSIMPDMTATWEAVHQIFISEHKEEGHDRYERSEANLPLDAGPNQFGLGYSNYQITADVKRQLLTGEENELIGTANIPVPKPEGWDGSWNISLFVSWQIDITLPPVELIITAPGYEQWRPEGNIKKPTEPGNKLVARATLQPKAGESGSFVPKIKSIRFQLLDTSREPGICLNWPLEAKDADYDLRLVALGGGELNKTEQMLEVRNPRKNDEGQYYAETQIDSYDFGGRASLRAVCLLNDGREIEGVMKDVGEMPRLPKMKQTQGWIADSWRKTHQAEKLADDDDNEEIKKQKDNGDGFTLYEEYRGWVVKEKRLEGDPKRKDFFVLNLIGGDANGGIDLFEELSQLRVHSKLKRSEMSEKTRLMNGNRSDGPHNKDQHGVWVKTFGSKSELGDNGAMTVINKKGVGLAGRPGLVDGIGILARDNTESAFNQPFNLPAQDAVFAYDRAIAHELLHSVGVEHHGKGDYHQILGYVSPRNPFNKVGRPYYATSPNKPPTVVLTEEGHDLAAKDYEDYVKMREFGDAALGERLHKEGAQWIARNGVGYNGINTPQQYADMHIEILVVFCFMNIKGNVGVEHGEDSGEEDCLMRYYFAKFYEATGGKDTLYVVTPGTERIGLEICHSGKGTGVNATGHKPQSRYGNAAADAGNCFEQICPNDAIPPRTTK